ncbi:MAG: iron chelate uptake ABC transporter family permease subunit [Paracoccaceae bacterium]
MFDDFLIRAALAAIGLSLATGPLGAFVIWRKMAYFGDTIAHAAILGVAVSLAFSISIFVGTLLVSFGVGLLAANFTDTRRSMDSILGVLSYSALALGLVAISFVKGANIDLNALLFGDILTVTKANLVQVWAVSLLILALLAWRWTSLLTATLSEEIAASVGINSARERLVLTLALAIVVAVSLKVVGAMLIGAMLIIPAAAARGFSRSPEKMAGIAIVIGAFSGVGGVIASAVIDAPTGPSIVVVAAMVFVASQFVARDQK